MLQVGPRSQKLIDSGAQKSSKSELWSSKSASKIDKDSRSKKRESKVGKSGSKNQNVVLWSRHFVLQGSLGKTISKTYTIRNRGPFSHDADGLKPSEFFIIMLHGRKTRLRMHHGFMRHGLFSNPGWPRTGRRPPAAANNPLSDKLAPA